MVISYPYLSHLSASPLLLREKHCVIISNGHFLSISIRFASSPSRKTLRYNQQWSFPIHIFPISSTVHKTFTDEKMPLHELRDKSCLDEILEEEEVLADLIQVSPLSTPFCSQRIQTHKPTSEGGYEHSDMRHVKASIQLLTEVHLCLFTSHSLYCADVAPVQTWRLSEESAATDCSQRKKVCADRC